MKLVFELIFFVIILSGGTFLVLVNLSLSSYGTVLGVSTSSVYMFAILNSVIWAILVKSVRPSAGGSDDFMSFLQSVYEEEEELTEEKIDRNDNESSTDSHDYQYDSSDTEGYDGEDDESNNNDEQDLDDIDEEEYGDTLNSRIEEFIAKVIKGWREEQMEENLKERVD